MRFTVVHIVKEVKKLVFLFHNSTAQAEKSEKINTHNMKSQVLKSRPRSIFFERLNCHKVRMSNNALVGRRHSMVIVSEGFFLHKRGKPKFPQPCLYTQGSYVCIEMKSTEKAKL